MSHILIWSLGLPSHFKSIIEVNYFISIIPLRISALFLIFYLDSIPQTEIRMVYPQLLEFSNSLDYTVKPKHNFSFLFKQLNIFEWQGFLGYEILHSFLDLQPKLGGPPIFVFHYWLRINIMSVNTFKFPPVFR